jgi:hypothetical protein
VRLIAVSLVLLTVAACAPRPAPDWQAGEVAHLRERRAQLPGDVRIDLCAHAIDSPDGRTLFVGGSFRDGAGSCRSALFVSRDGGRTWEEVPVWRYGSEVCLVRCLDARHAWFVTCWSIEGNQAPYHVFRTRDGGRTWRRSDALPPDIEGSLCYPSAFTFLDPDNGIVTFWTTSGEIATYRTFDGGLCWNRIRTAKGGPDEVWNAMEEFRPALHNPAYAIRDDWEGERIYVLRREGRTRAWRVLGTLPYTWRLDGDDVVARPPGAKARVLSAALQLESVHVAVDAGGGEPASIGSYSVSVFGDAERTDFVTGIVRPRNGSIVRHWVRDLDDDGRPEIAVWLRSAGSGSRGTLDVVRLSGRELSSVPLAALTKAQRRGYLGYDTYDVTEAGLTRTFPVYRPEDDLGRPTGGRASFRYDFWKCRWIPLRQTP